MTGQRATTRYASPSLRKWEGRRWGVYAHPYRRLVGYVDEASAGWTASKPSGLYAGLWPTKQAAAEVLVKQAGYELGEL